MVIRAPRPRSSSASAETFSARRVRLLVAYGAGLRWRSIGVLVGEVGVVVAIMALVPGFPFKQLSIGFVLGSITMVVALSVAQVDDPAVHGRWAEQWSVQALRKVKGWLVVDNVPFDGVDVDHVAVTPCGVLAVETKFHNRLSGDLAVEVHGRDLAAARAGAAKVRLLLRSFKLADVAVTPVLIVWGAGRPPLPNGYRRDGDVVVLDGRHPAVWTPLRRPAVVDGDPPPDRRADQRVRRGAR